MNCKQQIINLQREYFKEHKEFNSRNIMSLPKLQKVVVNMGVKHVSQNRDAIYLCAQDLYKITGQKPVLTKAKKSVAGFKIREYQHVGCCVILRNVQMYNFIYKLVNIVLPRIRDFNGLRIKFDQSHNYNLGLKEQIIFPEIDYDQTKYIQGMNITFVINSESNSDSYHLLKAMQLPFKRGK